MFLFVLIFLTFYLYFISKYRASLLLMLPAIFLYSIVAGIQYNVGTDYLSYIDIYGDEYRLLFHFNNNEYLFYYIVRFLNILSLPAQSLFICISFIQGFLLFYFLKKMHIKGVNIWLLFFVIFCVTNIYNNQLNLIRQFVSICMMPILIFLIVDKKYFHYLVGVLLASMFHFSSWILILFPILNFIKIKENFLPIIFFLSGGLYYFLGGSFEKIVSYLFLNYSHYFDSEFAEGMSLSGFLTKLYYLPIILYFFAIYKKNDGWLGDYFHICIVIFTLTYWSFIAAMQIGIFERFFTYFIFFYSFPIYYVINYFYRRNMPIIFFLLILYILIPYALKTTVFATAEFEYTSILKFIW